MALSKRHLFLAASATTLGIGGMLLPGATAMAGTPDQSVTATAPAAMTTTLQARAGEQAHGTSDVAVTAQPASMDHFEVHFHNYYQSTVYVAVMYRDYSGGCDDYGGWATAGWWQVARGQDVRVLNTTNRNVYFYAEAEDGTTWSDGDASMYVPANRDAFGSCQLIGSTASERVGVDRIDMGSTFSTHTVNLHG